MKFENKDNIVDIVQFSDFPLFNDGDGENLMKTFSRIELTSNSCNLYQLILNFSGFAYVYRTFSWGFARSSPWHNGLNYIKYTLSVLSFSLGLQGFSWRFDCYTRQSYKECFLACSRKGHNEKWKTGNPFQTMPEGSPGKEGHGEVFWILLMALLDPFIIIYSPIVTP